VAVYASGALFGSVFLSLVASTTALVPDGPGGLQRGLLLSAVALALGGLLAALQRPLPRP
jgi:hypothetical protein